MNITEIFSIEPKSIAKVLQLHRKTTVFVFEDNSALYVRINHKHIATTVYISNILDEQEVANVLARAQDSTAYTTARTILEGIRLHNAD
jgi:hypothetical protein